MSTTIKAQIAIVNLGLAQIEGLMGEDGQYYVGVPQLCVLLSIPTKNAAKALRVVLGEGFQFLQARTSLHPKAVNALTIAQFEFVLAKLDRKGNVQAQELRDALIGLSLAQLFSDAFGVKFEKDERAQWLKDRQAGILQRKTFTNQISDFVSRGGSDEEEWIVYARATNFVYQATFGRDANQLKIDLQCGKSQALRDCFLDSEVRAVDSLEELAARLMLNDKLTPDNAVREAAKRLERPVLNRKVKVVST
jgi:hypothetical protein